MIEETEAIEEMLEIMESCEEIVGAVQEDVTGLEGV